VSLDKGRIAEPAVKILDAPPAEIDMAVK